jgi:cytochrome c oxidase subunit 2
LSTKTTCRPAAAPASALALYFAAGLFLAPAAGAQETPPPTAAQALAADIASRPLIPENISTVGGEIDALFHVILWITGITLVGVQGLLVWFLWRYRHRSDRTKARYTHGSSRIEVTWSIATAAVLVYIAFAQRATWAKVKYAESFPALSDSFAVRVFAEQFIWRFIYPGPDGEFEEQHDDEIFPGLNNVGLADAEKDIEKAALIVPVNTKVVLELNSLGKYDPNVERLTVLPVLHSFFCMNLRAKQDIVPYYPGKIWFEATKPGRYEIVCAELCGEGHYQMRADFLVLEEAELEKALGYDWKARRPSEFPKPGTKLTK